MLSNRSIGARLGFSLVEALVGVTVFTLLALGIYRGFGSIMRLSEFSRVKTAAALVANSQFELMRNLPYGDIGLLGGIPAGVLPRTQVVAANGFTFNATTTIRNIDDPFDGTIAGTPKDFSPADYKLVEISLACPEAVCGLSSPLTFTATIAPPHLETTTGNGALFVQVLDASGQPVPQASVQVENQSSNPPIVIDEVTDNAGMLQLVDVPPGLTSYAVAVSKSGYSSSRTYPDDDPENPNPVDMDATVVAGQVTQVTLAIDRLSEVTFKTLSSVCSQVDSVNFNLRGVKKIGTNPDIFKYQSNQVTNVSGERVVPDLEWDTYEVTLGAGNYHLAGSIPLLPLVVPPDATSEAVLTMALAEPNGVLVAVKDSATGLPLDNVSVTIGSKTLETDKGFWRQTDWSGGSGQDNFLAVNRYAVDDGNVDVLTTPGLFTLRGAFGTFVPAGVLTSSVFDTGASTTNFYQLTWQTEAQPPETGTDPVRFQLATASTNTATTTWTYLGPDGTASSYYVLGTYDIPDVHDGDRYVRYRVYLQTADVAYSPTVSDVSLTYGSECLPPGQILFSDLADGNYTVRATRSGYQTWEQTGLVFNQDWQMLVINMLPL